MLYLSSNEYPKLSVILAGVQGACAGYLGTLGLNQVKYFSLNSKNAALFLGSTFAVTELALKTTLLAINKALKDCKISTKVVPEATKNALSVGFASFLTAKIMEKAGLILGLSKEANILGYQTTALFLGVHLYNYSQLLSEAAVREKKLGGKVVAVGEWSEVDK